MAPEEMPPEWMWPFDDELVEWFEEVARARRSGSDDVEAPMMQNELSERRARR